MRRAGAGRQKDERIYLGGFEIYREYAADGITVTLERETLHVMDDAQRIALVETRTAGTDPSPAQLIRYQLGNHLGSSSIELDAQAAIISYEEYYPYGSTSYQAVRNQVETAKRYRYTGKERDEETGLAYHGARYYAPWLARWTVADPAGLVDGTNLYEYVRGSPIVLRDPNGMGSKTLYLGHSRKPEDKQRFNETWGGNQYWVDTDNSNTTGWYVRTEGNRILPAPDLDGGDHDLPSERDLEPRRAQHEQRKRTRLAKAAAALDDLRWTRQSIRGVITQLGNLDAKIGGLIAEYELMKLNQTLLKERALMAPESVSQLDEMPAAMRSVLEQISQVRDEAAQTRRLLASFIRLEARQERYVRSFGLVRFPAEDGPHVGRRQLTPKERLDQFNKQVDAIKNGIMPGVLIVAGETVSQVFMDEPLSPRELKDLAALGLALDIGINGIAMKDKNATPVHGTRRTQVEAKSDAEMHTQMMNSPVVNKPTIPGSPLIKWEGGY